MKLTAVHVKRSPAANQQRVVTMETQQSRNMAMDVFKTQLMGHTNVHCNSYNISAGQDVALETS